MSQASDLIAGIRQDLQPIVEQLLRHPYLQALEDGRISRPKLRRFAGEQYLIIDSDLRSVAQLVSRFGHRPISRDFFLDVLQGERAAWGALHSFAQALGMDPAELRAYEPLPGAHAYTCYMAWLGLYGSAAEVAAAYLVNFAAWGENCGRMSRILQERHGLSSADVLFFDQFAATVPSFEPNALAVIQDGLDRGVEPRLIHRAARLLQGYEVLYWDTLAQASSG